MWLCERCTGKTLFPDFDECNILFSLSGLCYAFQMKIFNLICRIIIVASCVFALNGCTKTMAARSDAPSLEQVGLTLGAIAISPLVIAFALTGTEGTDTPDTAESLYYDLATEEIYRQRWKNSGKCDVHHIPVYPVHNQ